MRPRHSSYSTATLLDQQRQEGRQQRQQLQTPTQTNRPPLSGVTKPRSVGALTMRKIENDAIIIDSEWSDKIETTVHPRPYDINLSIRERRRSVESVEGGREYAFVEENEQTGNSGRESIAVKEIETEEDIRKVRSAKNVEYSSGRKKERNLQQMSDHKRTSWFEKKSEFLGVNLKNEAKTQQPSGRKTRETTNIVMKSFKEDQRGIVTNKNSRNAANTALANSTHEAAAAYNHTQYSQTGGVNRKAHRFVRQINDNDFDLRKRKETAERGDINNVIDAPKRRKRENVKRKTDTDISGQINDVQSSESIRGTSNHLPESNPLTISVDKLVHYGNNENNNNRVHVVPYHGEQNEVNKHKKNTTTVYGNSSRLKSTAAGGGNVNSNNITSAEYYRDNRYAETLAHVAHVFHYIGIGILGIFVIQVSV